MAMSVPQIKLVFLAVFPNCTTEEWQCENRQCIRSNQHCDLIQDCIDGSDERNCGKIVLSMLPGYALLSMKIQLLGRLISKLHEPFRVFRNQPFDKTILLLPLQHISRPHTALHTLLVEVINGLTKVIVTLIWTPKH